MIGWAMKVKDLKPAEYNPRKITDDKLKMLGKAMREFGDLSGVIFNRRTGHMIGGHQRLKHLNPEWTIHKEPHRDEQGTVALGYIDTPFGRWIYREVEWEEKREKLANIAANHHGGEDDYPKLKDLIVEIDDGSIDIELSGFDQGELESTFGITKAGLTDTDEDVCQKCRFRSANKAKLLNGK
jgi:hypothetical protein